MPVFTAAPPRKALLFNDTSAFAEFGGLNGRLLPGGAGSDDYTIKMSHSQYSQLRAPAGSASPRGKSTAQPSPAGRRVGASQARGRPPTRPSEVTGLAAFRAG